MAQNKKVLSRDEALGVDEVGLRTFIELWVLMSKCYFFTPPHSKNREYYNDNHSGEILIKVGARTFEGSIKTVSHSSYIDCTRTLTVNGERKNITVLKNLLKMVQEYPSKCPLEELPLLLGTKYESVAVKRLKEAA